VAFERRETSQFEGIVPFLLIKSRITGKRLVSLPLTSYCDPLVPEQELEHVVHFAFEHHPDIDYLELRFLENIGKHTTSIFQNQSYFVTHILRLDLELDQLFKSFHDTSVRQRIKRAGKKGLRFRIAEEEEDLRKFYQLQTAVRKRHGLPPQPYSFFANLWKLLRPRNFLSVPLIEYEGKVIAAAIVLKFKRTFHLEYSASDQNFLKLCPNQKLIWEVIKIAHRDGARYFDFGRSSVKHRSLIEFKERWGAKRHHLIYCHFPKTKRKDMESGVWRKILEFTNGHLPCRLLQLEGRLIYPHLG
jgi:hypothetical protein